MVVIKRLGRSADRSRMPKESILQHSAGFGHFANSSSQAVSPGELLLQMGRSQDAALYFESFWNDPLMAYRLGRVYEQMGDQTKARKAYALVASAWKDADPELQPRAREARAAIQRLTSSVRE